MAYVRVGFGRVDPKSHAGRWKGRVWHLSRQADLEWGVGVHGVPSPQTPQIPPTSLLLYFPWNLGTASTPNTPTRFYIWTGVLTIRCFIGDSARFGDWNMV